jgi:transglutaminase/protease-like cytokinesis protein 3
MKKLNLIILLFFVAISSHAQVDKYKYVDETVKKIGSMPKNNVAEIAAKITKDFKANEDKARAIYYWIANNIAIDPKATKKNDPKNTLPELVIAGRKTTPLGFSLLVQEMCSYAKIRCLSIDGYVKNNAEEINTKAEEKNYSWNVVQLGQSPETWYYIDACRASGSLDAKYTVFTKEFTSQYFFTDKRLFNLIYFPDNMAWQLGEASVKNVTSYYQLPIISNYAVSLEMRKLAPLTGLIKTKINIPINFSFTINNENTITKIVLIKGVGKKLSKEEAMNFTNDNGNVSFSYTFKKEEDFQLQVIVNGKVLLQYLVEVKEK